MWLDADAPPLGRCYGTKVQTSTLMHDVIAAMTPPLFADCLTQMVYRHSTDLTSRLLTGFWAAQLVFPLQGKGTDRGPQPNDGGRSTQHSCSQPAGRPRWGLADHLAPERWPQTALWTECKKWGCEGQWKLPFHLLTINSNNSAQPKRDLTASVLSLTSEMLHRRRKCLPSSSPSMRWSPS